MEFDIKEFRDRISQLKFKREEEKQKSDQNFKAAMEQYYIYEKTLNEIN